MIRYVTTGLGPRIQALMGRMCVSWGSIWVGHISWTTGENPRRSPEPSSSSVASLLVSGSENPVQCDLTLPCHVEHKDYCVTLLLSLVSPPLYLLPASLSLPLSLSSNQ